MSALLGIRGKHALWNCSACKTGLLTWLATSQDARRPAICMWLQKFWECTCIQHRTRWRPPREIYDALTWQRAESGQGMICCASPALTEVVDVYTGDCLKVFNCHVHLMLLSMFVFGAKAPPVGQCLLIHEVSRSHTQRRTTVGRTPLDEWSTRRIDLYLTTHTTLTTDEHPCPLWDSNPQSQQASCRRPTP